MINGSYSSSIAPVRSWETVLFCACKKNVALEGSTYPQLNKLLTPDISVVRQFSSDLFHVNWSAQRASIAVSSGMVEETKEEKESGNRKISQIYMLNRHVFAVGA